MRELFPKKIVESKWPHFQVGWSEMHSRTYIIITEVPMKRLIIKAFHIA